MGINTRLGNRPKREELTDAMEVHDDNRRVVGFASIGSAAISTMFAFKYGVDSTGAMVFAAGTVFGGASTVAEAMDYSVAYRDLAVLDDSAREIY